MPEDTNAAQPTDNTVDLTKPAGTPPANQPADPVNEGTAPTESYDEQMEQATQAAIQAPPTPEEQPLGETTMKEPITPKAPAAEVSQIDPIEISNQDDAPEVDAFKMSGGVDTEPVKDDAANGQIPVDAALPIQPEAPVQPEATEVPPATTQVVEQATTVSPEEVGIPLGITKEVAPGDEMDETPKSKKTLMMIIGAILIGVAILIAASGFYLFIYLPDQEAEVQPEPQLEQPVVVEPEIPPQDDPDEVNLDEDEIIKQIEEAELETNLNEIEKNLETIDFEGFDTELQETEL